MLPVNIDLLAISKCVSSEWPSIATQLDRSTLELSTTVILETPHFTSISRR
jgi:hypothetical protein